MHTLDLLLHTVWLRPYVFLFMAAYLAMAVPAWGWQAAPVRFSLWGPSWPALPGPSGIPEQQGATTGFPTRRRDGCHTPSVCAVRVSFHPSLAPGGA